MEETKFNKMLYAIAVGLYEKEHCDEKYAYSNHLMYGLNMLSALAVQNHQLKMLMELHESAFLEKYATKPVKKWFYGWDELFVETISEFSLFQTNALITLDDRHSFHITEECSDLCKDTEDDMFKALEQRMVYEKMKELSESDYTAVRKFIVEHPVCTKQDFRTFKITHSVQEILEIIAMSYEDIPEGSYQCRACGWTMQFHGNQAVCCNRSCTLHHPTPEQLNLLDVSEMQRLKHGIMRYMCLPGKLELEIQHKAEECGYQTKLWPEKDQYDIQIILHDGNKWAVDAKMYRNPYLLASAIKNDGAFETVSADKRFYVVPSEALKEYSDYCDICNASLKGKFVTCITERELYQMLRKVKSNA
ncbi:MAG: hypothetical protein NC548_31945 [Lachnospiraceae bacterium]|nr:hypothetical protein [Lachnospiraceae bacterium]MCM1230492.1 hypothetical protein [Ruminococcus flavefaciens]